MASLKPDDKVLVLMKQESEVPFLHYQVDGNGEQEEIERLKIFMNLITGQLPFLRPQRSIQRTGTHAGRGTDYLFEKYNCFTGGWESLKEHRKKRGLPPLDHGTGHLQTGSSFLIQSHNQTRQNRS